MDCDPELFFRVHGKFPLVPAWQGAAGFIKHICQFRRGMDPIFHPARAGLQIFYSRPTDIRAVQDNEGTGVCCQRNTFLLEQKWIMRTMTEKLFFQFFKNFKPLRLIQHTCLTEIPGCTADIGPVGSQFFSAVLQQIASRQTGFRSMPDIRKTRPEQWLCFLRLDIFKCSAPGGKNFCRSGGRFCFLPEKHIRQQNIQSHDPLRGMFCQCFPEQASGFCCRDNDPVRRKVDRTGIFCISKKPLDCKLRQRLFPS